MRKKTNRNKSDYFLGYPEDFIFHPSRVDDTKIEIDIGSLEKQEKRVYVKPHQTKRGPVKGHYRIVRGDMKDIKDQIRYLSTEEQENLAATTDDQDVLKLLNRETLSVRKIVAKRIDMEGLHAIAKKIEDDEPEIANIVFSRIDMKGLYEHMDSEYESTRVRVAKNIDQKGLHQMMNDPSDFVREKVASRIDQSGLLEMMTDSDSAVRSEVASRIDAKELHKMIRDPDEYVRSKVASRIDMEGLYELMDDRSDGVKLIVASRIDKKGLEIMKEKNRDNSELSEYINVRLSLSNFITKDVIEKFQKSGEIQFNEDVKQIIKNVKEFSIEHDAIVELVDKLYSGSEYNDFHLESRRDWVDNPNLGTSLLLKDSIARIYKRKTYYSSLSENEKQEYIDKLYKKYPKSMIDRYVRLQKSLTRQLIDIKYPYSDTLTVYRGTSTGQPVGYGTKLEVKENPLSSWSMREDVARDFADKTENGIVLKTKVHKDDIWSCYLTHSYGVASEKGVLSLLGGGLKPENEIILISSDDRIAKVV